MMAKNVVIPLDTQRKKDNTVAALKAMCKERGIKVSGKKDELKRRLEEYNLKYNASTCIKSLWKGYHLRNRLVWQGDVLGAFSNRCTNVCDFKTLDELDDIPLHHRFTYKDESGFQYGFNIYSFMEILKRAKTVLKDDAPFLVKNINYDAKSLNPYDRRVIPNSDVKRAVCLINKVTKASRYAKQTSVKPVKPSGPLIVLNDTNMTMNRVRQIEQLAVETFQRMDELGHYTNYMWLWGLSRISLSRFKNELRDVFNFRAGLTPEIKRNILPPHGSIDALMNNTNKIYAKYYRCHENYHHLERHRAKCRVVLTTSYDIPSFVLVGPHYVNNEPADVPPPPEYYLNHTFDIKDRDDASHVMEYLQNTHHDMSPDTRDHIVHTIFLHVLQLKKAKADMDDAYYELLHDILIVINQLISSGINHDSCALGCYYVLGSLTVVSNEAANALPWLWQSFY